MGMTLDERIERNRKWLAVLYRTAIATEAECVRRTSDALWGRRVAGASRHLLTDIERYLLDVGAHLIWIRTVGFQSLDRTAIGLMI